VTTRFPSTQTALLLGSNLSSEDGWGLAALGVAVTRHL
jgi:hypothetical protein